MQKNVLFEKWNKSCSKVWNSEVPLLKLPRSRKNIAANSSPKQLVLPSLNKTATSCYDELSARVLVEDTWNEDGDLTHQVFIEKKHIHSDLLVQNEIQARLVDYFTGNDYWTLRTRTHCPYCRHELDYAVFEDNDEREFGIALESCSRCNYWNWHYFAYAHISRWNLTAYAYTTYLGKLREFDEKLPDGCVEEIAAWIRRNPKRWHTIHPTSFEKLVADIFRANYHSANVQHVGKPDDGGIDVIYIDADQNQWLVQVKRREHGTSVESISTIRNLLGTMLLENASHGIVVSTADHFSYRAYEAVNYAHKIGMTIRLIDRRALDQMLTGILVDKPWLDPLKQNFPEFISYLKAETNIVSQNKHTQNSASGDNSELLASFTPHPTDEQIRKYYENQANKNRRP